MAYSREWLLECILMKMKSPRLYQHIRINKILALPEKTCLKKSLQHFKSGFGFNKKVFSVLKEKTDSLENSEKHGNLLFDELKLSENLKMDSNGVVQGYVNYGPDLTPDSEMGLKCNHGLVLLFQPFRGDWVQIIGVFGTHQNVKADHLSKILIKAVILCENAGLFVDAITGDGATWNRAMWRKFGIGQSKEGIVKYKVVHPCDSARNLHFISDFPHLLKCLRNRFLSKGYLTPAGEVRPEFLKEAWKQDQKSTVKLKVMPKLSYVHLHPNGFEKMRVNIAFQLFGDEVIKGLSFYSEEISVYGEPKPTVDFIKRINNLIKVMTSRTPKTALRNGSSQSKSLLDFVEFINKWEESSKAINCLGYLSKSTVLGLKWKFRSISCQCFDKSNAALNSAKEILQGLLDDLIDSGKLTEACKILKDSTSNQNLSIQHSDSRLIYYTSGYIVRKFLKITRCEECRVLLSDKQDDTDTVIEEAHYTKQFDLGRLMYPSQQLFELVCILENHFTECISTNSLHRDITFEIVEELKEHVFHLSAASCTTKNSPKILLNFIF
ncbi:hypothetical protein JTE90_018719 [Oedothorax gibbosus]|uniref:Uncharacterized protein n=1 Tax=Oedothorax gibbosus TaxID=931172 RepID=A0AAV6UKU7_9ARAC|nr:hypothetical protein JTE90_018719 [Oedothorax gibbosus]